MKLESLHDLYLLELKDLLRNSRKTGPRPRRHYPASSYPSWRRGHAPLCAL